MGNEGRLGDGRVYGYMGIKVGRGEYMGIKGGEENVYGDKEGGGSKNSNRAEHVCQPSLFSQ